MSCSEKDAQKNKYAQNHLNILIDFTRGDPRVAALRLPPLVQIKDKDKEQTIDRILDIVYDAYDNIEDFYNKFTSRIYLNSNNIFKLISLIQRNRRNAKKLHDYFILLRNYTDAKDQFAFLVVEYAKLFRKESLNNTFKVFDQFNNAKNDLKTHKRYQKR